MSVSLYRMIDHRPGLLPVIGIVAVLIVGGGDVQARLLPVTSGVMNVSAKGAAPASRLSSSLETQAAPAAVSAPAADDPTFLLPDPREIGTIDITTRTPIVTAPRDMSALANAVQQEIAASGASVGVTLVELSGADPMVWSINGAGVFTAASTYKLAALMLEAQNIAAGKTDPNGLVCYQSDDFETGWFDDYEDGACFTRNELAVRAGKYSDNTAGHMLVRDIGGAATLDAWAASLGATSSTFFIENTTTSADLAALWTAEVQGKLGGAVAQAWLYPLLTNTRTEGGIPAGVGGGVTVVHKTGTLDLVDNDAALVTNGPDGPYLLVVMTDGLGGAEGWQLIAGISASVSQFETARSAAPTAG
jgi:beta-lactamase class A